ncbi:MAG: tRNA methyltransferase, partial [Rhodospirillales bacterium]|nr:tRNA methyltransferase [Rhodospirillales bacterium]
DFRDVDYKPNDILLMGRESAGVPDFVHDRADLRITIPLAEGNRSLNVAMTAAMVTSEALRQTDGFPKNS